MEDNRKEYKRERENGFMRLLLQAASRKPLREFHATLLEGDQHPFGLERHDPEERGRGMSHYLCFIWGATDIAVETFNKLLTFEMTA